MNDFEEYTLQVGTFEGIPIIRTVTSTKRNAQTWFYSLGNI